MHYGHQRIKKQARANKDADALKKPALEAEELAGLSAVEEDYLALHDGGADKEQRFDAFVVVPALSQLIRRVGELEQQLESLRQQHTDATEFDEGVELTSDPPGEEGIDR